VAGADIAAGLLLWYGLAYALGGLAALSSAWAFPVVLVAAARFRYVGAILTAIAATIVTGPLMPLSVSVGTQQGLALWIGRGPVFLLVGVLTAYLIDEVVADRDREVELARQERELVARQVAVIATVSHEFRTPLTIIGGVARTIETQRMVTPEALPLLAGLHDATRRLTDLVNAVGAVLDDSRAGTFVRAETVFFRDVCSQVLVSLGVRDPKSRVHVDVDPSAEFFVSDRELLTQLLRHVVDNAVTFSPETEPVQVTARRAGGRLEVHVLDRGPGIDRELLDSPHLFKQADQSDTRSKRGLGLGLVAASRLATILGGSVEYEPRSGGGTVSILDLRAPDAT
jgi:signal transduction histidine kinase